MRTVRKCVVVLGKVMLKMQISSFRHSGLLPKFSYDAALLIDIDCRFTVNYQWIT